ncbi:hypothetical protein Kpol_467p7 [Vanderwaltozyma polyspora DSM 70294]|uniref:Isocitrate lyase n=1 Tax=Vanderwaltozyma polyspora (strain ATCC 22028 / DSM 70294 / BCRC 21397 / CBS 2163 / NBRC 10782 / NRRL Y-8283 / UCD 57-17) TaxID=436907 RepID=A7TQF1_VANPO|nr:uncharacterized protein Kpol_467p7 [Vanderwaltozyma polyspora DSM 70294]EDO15495.1 hypothetical protein Kpol_467p7 [Vanderwaltozyma polyspora DSM 70294]
MSKMSKLILTRRFNHTTSYSKDLAQIEAFFNKKRFKNVKRPYKSIDVLKHRGSINYLQENATPVSSLISRKLFNLLETHFKERKPLHTLGVLDPVQMSQLARCENIKVAYVSGWACSANANDNVSPDFGDYPYDTVPNQVGRIFNAQLMHDKKLHLQNFNSGRNNNSDKIDYLKPIIADADMGHGGITTVMKLAKLFAEKGASAIHLEDQLVGSKKCGHLGGTVVVPTSTHLQRIIATRFQWDLMGAENLVIARTDSCNSNLISSDIDARDHKFIKGIAVENNDIRPVSEVLLEEELKQEKYGHSTSSDSLNSIEQEWYKENKLLTFDEYMIQTLTDSEYTNLIKERSELLKKLGRRYLSISEMKQLANKISPRKNLTFNWYYPRTKEGHFMFNGCLEAAIERSLLFSYYSDLIWLETKTPNLLQAKNFAMTIHEKNPNIKFVYNLSPSFNWEAQGFNQETLKSFIWDLAKHGFVLQLVSLAGLHANGLGTWKLAKEFQYDGMKAYVNNIQNVERQTNSDMLTHQKWSGIDYIESISNVIQNGQSSMTSSTSGSGFTEKHF